MTLLLCTTGYGLSRIARLATDRQPRWGLLVFWLSSVFMLLIPGVVQLSDATFFWPTWGAYDTETVTTAAMLLGLGMLLVDLTYQAVGQRVEPAPVRHETPMLPQARAFTWLCWLAVAWSLTLGVMLGPVFFLRSRGTLAGALAQIFSIPTLGLGVTLGSALLSTLLVLGVRLRLSPLPAATRRQTTRWLAVMLLCNGVINFPGGQARYPLLATLLMLLVLTARQRQAWPAARRWLTYAFAPLLYGVVRFQGAYNRDSGYDLAGAWHAMLQPLATLHHGDFDGMQMTIAGVRYAAAQGHTWGQQLASGALFFIPRAWWPGKAVPTGSLLAQHEAFAYTNLGAPLLLEGWLDFSWCGLVLVAVLLGLALQRADRAIASDTSLSAIAWVAFLPIVLRGALLAVIAPVAAVFFWLWLSERLANRDRSAGFSGSAGGAGERETPER